MANASNVEGLQKLLAELKAKGKALEAGVSRGLRKAGLFLQRESQKLVPVWTGNLRAGAFTRHTGSGFNIEVRVGYTAEYALYVHEDLNAAHGSVFNTKYANEIAGKVDPSYYFKRRPDEKAKFLEIPLRTKQAEMRQIINTEASKAA